MADGLRSQRHTAGNVDWHSWRAKAALDIDDTVPQAAQADRGLQLHRLRPMPVPATPSARRRAESVESGGRVRVTTDVLVLDIDLKGGTLVYAELPGYPMIKGQTAASGVVQPGRRRD